jgi:hypothetical protein
MCSSCTGSDSGEKERKDSLSFIHLAGFQSTLDNNNNNNNNNSRAADDSSELIDSRGTCSRELLGGALR